MIDFCRNRSRMFSFPVPAFRGRALASISNLNSPQRVCILLQLTSYRRCASLSVAHSRVHNRNLGTRVLVFRFGQDGFMLTRFCRLRHIMQERVAKGGNRKTFRNRERFRKKSLALRIEMRTAEKREAKLSAPSHLTATGGSVFQNTTFSEKRPFRP